jgi:hypothetical protein
MSEARRIVVHVSYAHRLNSLVAKMKRAGMELAEFEVAEWREEAEKAGLPAEAIDLIVRLAELELASPTA